MLEIGRKTRLLMHRIPRMAAAFIRLVTTFGLLLLIVFAAWTTLFLSARYSHRLVDRPVYSFLDPTDNRTWKPPGRLLVAGNDGKFYLNGRPKRLISGEFHYFRVHPGHWDDRLRRMRTAGLNTITTRIPWNLHEKRQSIFHFHGLWNLHNFIRLVHRLGFLLIVHVGPYIDADWEFGGLPSWLLRDRHMVLRSSSYQPYLQYVRRYMSHLLSIIERWTYRKHGPIVAIQIENEFGSYGHEDTDYLRELVQLIRSHAIQELILTADRAAHLSEGAVPGAMVTVTCRGTVDEVQAALSGLSSLQPGLPRLVTLMDRNGTSRWGEITTHRQTAVTSVDNFRRSLDLVLSSNASVNIYAFASGTSFGLWSGAVEDTGIDSTSVNLVRQAVRRKGKHRQRRTKHDTPPHTTPPIAAIVSSEQTSGLVYRPTTTSYNYSPPPIISQSGHSQFSLKYHVLRRLLLDKAVISRLQTPPTNPTSIALGAVRMDHQLSWDVILDLIPESPVLLDSPVYMEQLNTRLGSGQDQGLIVYRTRIHGHGSNSKLNISGTMRDRAQVYVNGNLIETVYNNRLLPFIVITVLDSQQKPSTTRNSDHGPSTNSAASTTLELVVENMGRSSFGLLDEQRKGFEGVVIVDGKVVESQWEHYSVDFSSAFLTAVRQYKHWTPVLRPLTTGQVQGQPTLYGGRFKVKQVKDTYIDMTKWTKGIVIINGFVLGRYWNIGPQQFLYVPSPVLIHGMNEVLVFELESTVNAKLRFVAKPSSDHQKHRT